MIKGKTFYLDESMLDLFPTRYGWDTITFCERSVYRKRELKTEANGIINRKDASANTTNTTIYDYQWSAICKTGDEVWCEIIIEDEFAEEHEYQYKMTPTKKKPAAKPKAKGGKLSGGERRVVDILTSRAHAIKTERLSELSGLKPNTLHTYISSLRAKGYEIIQRQRRYLPLSQGETN